MGKHESECESTEQEPPNLEKNYVGVKVLFLLFFFNIQTILLDFFIYTQKTGRLNHASIWLYPSYLARHTYREVASSYFKTFAFFIFVESATHGVVYISYLCVASPYNN